MVAIEINQEEFKNELNKKDEILILVKFWAPWCKPCHVIANYLNELCQKYEKSYKIFSINIENNEEIISKFGIRVLPTLKIFKKGSEIDSKFGSIPKDFIDQWMTDTLNKSKDIK